MNKFTITLLKRHTYTLYLLQSTIIHYIYSKNVLLHIHVLYYTLRCIQILVNIMTYPIKKQFFWKLICSHSHFSCIFNFNSNKNQNK